jgi:putative flippase GtrA
MNARTAFRRYGQFIKFNLVGLVNTLVDYAVYSLLVTLGVQYLAAQVVSYSAGMVNSYLMNKYWTFGERKTAVSGTQLLRFILLNLATLGLALLVLYVFSRQWGIHPLVSKLAATVLTMAVNFVGSKLWVYRPVDTPEKPDESVKKFGQQR